MNEQERLAYLQAMGVDSYVPRVVLPGARPSPVQPLVAILPPVATPVAGDRQPEALADLRRELGAARPAPATKPANTRRNAPVAVAKTTVASSQDDISSFQLVIFHPIPALLLLVPQLHTDKAHLQLLGNILQAIDVRTAALVPKGNFAWPLPGARPGGPIGNDLASARETLESLLEGYRQKQGVQRVLVFSLQLGKLLFPATNDHGVQSSPLMIQVVPGLKEMLEDSQQKKLAWQRLRPLKKES